jgi:hypothetical protein
LWIYLTVKNSLEKNIKKSTDQLQENARWSPEHVWKRGQKDQSIISGGSDDENGRTDPWAQQPRSTVEVLWRHHLVERRAKVRAASTRLATHCPLILAPWQTCSHKNILVLHTKIKNQEPVAVQPYLLSAARLVPDLIIYLSFGWWAPLPPSPCQRPKARSTVSQKCGMTSREWVWSQASRDKRRFAEARRYTYSSVALTPVVGKHFPGWNSMFGTGSALCRMRTGEDVHFLFWVHQPHTYTCHDALVHDGILITCSKQGLATRRIHEFGTGKGSAHDAMNVPYWLLAYDQVHPSGMNHINLLCFI